MESTHFSFTKIKIIWHKIPFGRSDQKSQSHPGLIFHGVAVAMTRTSHFILMGKMLNSYNSVT